MNILVCKSFGIGNAVMALPMVKALRSMGNRVDILCGDTPDDFGAFDVFLVAKHQGHVDGVYRGSARDIRYDLAILAIPCDGRWMNGRQFEADRFMDNRTRPDPSTTGLVSWKRHEVEYQMDNARELGYVGETPDCSFMVTEEWALRPRCFYLGVGYKKDPAGFWKKKHWGNDNYIQLIRLLLAEHPMNLVCTSGDRADLQLTIAPIAREVNDKRFSFGSTTVGDSFHTVSRCGTYVGNDTGMMHVAASANRNVVGLFFMENSIVKNHAWCTNRLDIDGSRGPVTPEEVLMKIKEVRANGYL